MAKAQTTKAEKERVRRQIKSLIHRLQKLHELSDPGRVKGPHDKQQLDLHIKKVKQIVGNKTFGNGFPHICKLRM